MNDDVVVLCGGCPVFGWRDNHYYPHKKILLLSVQTSNEFNQHNTNTNKITIQPIHSDTMAPNPHLDPDQIESLVPDYNARDDIESPGSSNPNCDTDFLNNYGDDAYSIDGGSDDDSQSDGEEDEFKVEERASRMMSDYRAYIAEMSSTPAGESLIDIPLGNHGSARDERRMKRLKYMKVFGSTRVRRGVSTLLMAVAIIGIALVGRKAKIAKGLPDWDAELAEVQKEEQEKHQQNLPKMQEISNAALQIMEPQVVTGIQRPPSSFEAMEVEEESVQSSEESTVDSGFGAEINAFSFDNERSSENQKELETEKSSEETNNASPLEPESSNNNPVQDIGHSIQDMVIKHDPSLFRRDDGWGGQTYMQAVSFCASKESRVPCAFEAICPLGEGTMSLIGNPDDPNGSWVPVFDAPNEWVQIGKDNSCKLYSSLNGSSPKWGLTGEDNEDITRNVMCCHEPAMTMPQEKNV